MKNKGVSVFANKFEFTINLPLQEVVSKFLFANYDLENNPSISTINFYSCGEGSSPSTHFIIYGTTKLGGVFHDRDYSFSCRYFKLSEDVVILAQEQSYAIPVSKKYIRSTFHLSGIQFKALSATSTQITQMLQVDANGNIPKCNF